VVLNGPIREALLNVEEFSSLLEAHVVVEARCVENKTHRPQSSVGGLARRRYAEYWAATNQHSHDRTQATIQGDYLVHSALVAFGIDDAEPVALVDQALYEPRHE
jgi:hypothetical protein